MLFNRSITTQFTIVFVVALLLVVGSFYLVLDSVYRNELKSQAETVADNVDAFGSWVSQYGRVWVRDDNKSYLGQVTLVSAPDAAGGAAAADVWHFYSKNPALAQRYGIQSIPTLLYFSNGEVQNQTIGAVSKRKIVEHLDELALAE